MRKVRTRTLISDRVAPPRNPPKGQPDSLDVYFKGPNVLVDPGFENYVAMTGNWYWPSRSNGTKDYVIPNLDLMCASWLAYPDACMTQSFPTWCQTSGPYSATGLREDQAWKVSTGNPRSGQWHAAWWNWDNGGIPPGELCPFNPYLSGPFSARVEPGDSISWSMWVYAGSLSVETPLTVTAIPILRFYAANYTLIRADVGTPLSLTANTYVQPSHTASAPTGTSYVRACMSFDGLTASLLLADDAVLGVQ